MSTPLSPAAQAMFSAFDDCYEAIGLDDWMGPCMAAFLRAAVEQTIKPDPLTGINSIIHASALLAIATELENQQ